MFISKFRSWSIAQRTLSLITIIGLFTSLGMTTPPIVPRRPDEPTSLPAPSNGLYLTDSAANPGIVDHIEPDSSLTTYYMRPVGGVNPLTHFALTSNGTLYFTDGSSANIYTLNAASSEVIAYTDQAGRPIRDLGFDATGNLYYSVGTGIDDGQILEIDSGFASATITYTVHVAQVGTRWQGDFAYDSSNNLFLSNGDASITNHIYQVSGTTPTAIFTGTGEIAGFVRDGSGAFYFTDTSTGIYRFTLGNPASLVWSIVPGMTVPDINIIGASGPVLTHFHGNVLYNPSRIQPQPGLAPAAISSQGQMSVPISILGFVSNNSAPIVLNSGLSQSDGSFDLPVLQSGFDHFDVTQGALRGTVPQTLTVPPGGSVLDVNTAKFGGSATGTICCTNFNLTDPVLKLPFFSQGRYLIVTSAALTGMIQDFVTFKEYQGYDVIVKTVEDLGGSGQTLMNNIRTYEKTLLAESKGLKYVLLIGTDKTVPYPKINEFGYDWYHMPISDATAACGFIPTTGNVCGWPSDWYYVDLNSNWDSNGDGIFGEAFWPDPKNGPPVQDTAPNFHPDVFLGRIPIDNDLSVWTALHAIMSFERDGGVWKDNTLMAGAMLDFGGQGWDPPDNVVTGTYQNLSGPTDTGKMLEQEFNNILAAQGFDRTRMYEKDHPPTGFAPSSFPVDAPLGVTQIFSAFQTTDFGLLKLAGHGNADGVYRLVWTHDYNLDGKVQNPERPTLISSKWTSQYELDFTNLFNTGYRAYYNSPNLKAPFLMAMSCSTGDAGNPGNLPATLLSEGQISGWTGGAGVIGYVAGWGKPSDGMAMTIDYDITGKIFKDHLPLGQGVWQGLNQYWNDMHAHDWGFIDWDFYGDPSMTYWSIGPDLSAPWPMFHYDMPGRGTTALTGPISPTLYWSSPIAATPLSGTTASPVIGANNEIVIGDSAGDMREYDALHSLLWTYHTGGAIVNAAVINSDGTVYVKSQDGYLYAIKSNGSLRWNLFEGNSEASPKVSGDGTIYAAGSDNTGPGGTQHYFIDSIQPNGTRNVRTYVDSRVTTTPAFDQYDEIYLGTANGTLYKMNFDLSGPEVFSITPGSAIGNGLAVVNTTEVIVPSMNGSVVAFDTWGNGSPLWTFPVSNTVQSAPAIADNVVYFGSRDGYVYAVNFSDGSLLWKYNTGGPVDSAPAVDPTNVYVIGGNPAKLYALRRFDGALIWSYSIAGSSFGGSSPAIGYDGIYVGSSAGKIKLIGNYLYLKPPILLINPELADIHILINTGDPAPDLVVQLERRIEGGQWQSLGNFTNGVFVDSNINGGVRYNYRATTKINGTLLKPGTVITGPSNYTPPIEVQAITPLTGSLGAPIVSPLSSAQLRLNWSAISTGTTSIVIMRKGPSDATFITDTVVPGSVTQTIDSSLLPATTYTYTLVALGQGGDSMQSPTGSGQTFSQTLIAPSNVTVQPLSDVKFHVCWTPAPENPVGAAIGREANGEFGPEIVGSVISGTTCFDDVSGYPDTFVYFVKHVQGSNESPWAQSGPVSAPDAPTSISYVYLPLTLKAH